ncbi:Sugar transport protein MST6 [Camellia lanceoleosa]|uniref:Sugar transport protein MST6 n=1 Tax=Camellia lanceoleosa TaxID=1840588 RepID=A0ACC0IGW8_9ERIC|nr:Sugar transport protein MST6 [Camellia lanceoleosa]
MTKKLGRKFSMLMGSCVFCCGALLNAFAVHLTMLIIDRILLGVGVGFATRGHFDKAKKQLQRIRGVADIQAEFNKLVDASAASKEVEHPWRNLLMSKYRPQLCLAILIPMFQQLTGINVVMLCAPVLFKTIGFQSNASLASAMITGGVNVLAAFIPCFYGEVASCLCFRFSANYEPLRHLLRVGDQQYSHRGNVTSVERDTDTEKKQKTWHFWRTGIVQSEESSATAAFARRSKDTNPLALMLGQHIQEGNLIDGIMLKETSTKKSRISNGVSKEEVKTSQTVGVVEEKKKLETRISKGVSSKLIKCEKNKEGRHSRKQTNAKKFQNKDIDPDIPLPQGTELTTVAGID